MRRIAYFSPLRPARTGIADYSEALLPFLARSLSLDLYVDGYAPESQSSLRDFEVLDCRLFEAIRRQRQYDAIVYQMGNSPYHDYIYETLLRRPGILVLHDLVMHHFFVARTLGQQDTSGYVREMAYNAPDGGADAARAAMTGNAPYPYYEMPLHHRMVDASLSVIAHNEFMASRLRADYPELPISCVPMLCPPAALVQSPGLTAELRQRWQIPEGALVVASFGRIAPPKRLDILLRALQALRRQIPSVFCLLVGEVVAPYDAAGLIRGLGLGEDSVRLTGHIPEAEYFASFDLADIAVNLRYPSAGESSAALIQLLGHGVPTIVSDVDAFSELPDTVAIKVPVTGKEMDALVLALTAHATRTALRQAVSRAARAYVANVHSPERAANGYLEHIEQTLARQRR